MRSWSLRTFWSVSIALIFVAGPVVMLGQGSPIPVKPGLWDMQVSVARVTALPPEAEARLAAMPPAQAEQVRAMMGGANKPVLTTRQACFTAQASMDSLLNQAQQSAGMQCSFTNRVQTSHGASYDMSCTGATGSAVGHTEFRMIDEEHISSVSHMTIAGSSHGTAISSTMDSTTSGRFVKADCGDVKPFAPTSGSR